jgi:predicted unusual protein kinase regulating ubiquinone biosynthesis (AarF/ABC1/UbiB family)
MQLMLLLLACSAKSGFVEAFTTPTSSIQKSAGKTLAPVFATTRSTSSVLFSSYQPKQDLATNNNNAISSRKIERLFGKKSTKASSFRAISALPFLLLKRSSFGSSVAWAASKATSIPTFNKEEILSYRIWCLLRVTAQNILTSVRHPTKDTFKAIAYTVISIYLLTNIVEGLAARKRQKLDATSEWGRYADKPAARGQALSLLLMRLTPYAILPLLLDKFSKKTKDDLSKEEYESTRAHKLRRRGGELFADGLLKLGPLYVKIGQILSCRENLFPDEWIKAMERLQDRVPAKSGKEAWELLYDAAPGGKAGFHKQFSDFDDVPLAAASLGQVHRATLRRSGELVAIKLQRSRLRDIYDKDLALMKKIAKAVDRLGSAGQVGGIEQSWVSIFNDAEEILYREIDYRDEAENAARFANDFGIGLGGVEIESTAKGIDGKTVLPSAAEWLRTPYTYSDLSSEKFLVMEYVPSIKANNKEALDKAGVTLEDREYLAECLAHAYLRQFCAHKFFSTDPHAGNLGIEVFEDGRAPRMVFYDFGQACSLADDQAGGILDVIESIVDSDAKKSVSAFSRMGVLKDGADLEKVQAKCQQNYDEGKLKVKKRKSRKSSRYNRKDKILAKESEKAELDARIDSAGQSKNIKDLSEGVKDSEVMEYFTLQSEYAFVARALSQMDGVGKSLDPDFDFISAAAPYLVEVKGTGKYLTDEIKKKFTFVYGEDGVLAKELKLFKSLGLKLPIKK